MLGLVSLLLILGALAACCSGHLVTQTSILPPFTLTLPFRGEIDEHNVEVTFKVCANERLEDAFDTLFFHLEFDMGPQTEEEKEQIRERVYKDTGTRPDGHPPRPIIGALHNTYFVRQHYDPLDIFLCYCSRDDSDCSSSDQKALKIWEYIIRCIEETMLERGTTEFETGSNLTFESLSLPPPASVPTSRIGISLGTSCRAAKLAVQMGLRRTKAEGYRTCPFDLMLSSYEGVVQCIRDDFRFLTDSTYLQVGEDRHIRNTYYNFTFVHESPPYFQYMLQRLKQPWDSGEDHFVMDDFHHLRELYARRIASFRQYMLSGSPVVFVLEIQTEVGDRHAEELENALREMYPGLEFSIKTLFTHPDADVTALLYDVWHGK